MPPQLKLAFIALVPDSDPAKHRSTMSTGMVELAVQFVTSLDNAIDMAKQLADQGCSMIELCGGFGHAMTGRIADAVRGKAIVGCVRFDVFPGLGRSSDELFGG